MRTKKHTVRHVSQRQFEVLRALCAGAVLWAPPFTGRHPGHPQLSPDPEDWTVSTTLRFVTVRGLLDHDLIEESTVGVSDEGEAIWVITPAGLAFVAANTPGP